MLKPVHLSILGASALWGGAFAVYSLIAHGGFLRPIFVVGGAGLLLVGFLLSWVALRRADSRWVHVVIAAGSLLFLLQVTIALTQPDDFFPVAASVVGSVLVAAAVVGALEGQVAERKNDKEGGKGP